jgi:methylthioribose-1-phosphate isomerase
MIVEGERYQSIWPDPVKKGIIRIIDQNALPFNFRIEELRSSEQALDAIKTMKVRGAPLIGVCGAFGLYLACLESKDMKDRQDYVSRQARLLGAARPTAVNLAWAVERVLNAVYGIPEYEEMVEISFHEAAGIMEEETASCLSIGEHGYRLIEEISRKKNGEPVNILTHCNAGWLACVDYGTATAPVYLAHDRGIPVHVWVDETRPRNQGARLTAWELGEHGVPHTVIVDNAGGYLMQKGEVDMVIVGSDRTTISGDVANKTGTYLKALAAHDNDIPFYVALPSSTIDFSIYSGLDEIQVEERDADEVRSLEGQHGDKIISVDIIPASSPVSNYGFDITPARLVSGLITEKGICGASENEIRKLFPER